MPPSRVRIPPSPPHSTERCPSGLRSATGNRVRAERCVAGSNPALSAQLSQFTLRGEESTPAATKIGRAGSPLIPPAFETRLRLSEAGFVFDGGMQPVNVWDYKRLAEEKLDAKAAAYFSGGAGGEITLRDNLAAFVRRKLRPRVLVDVATVSTKTTVLGTEIALPVLIAPLALQRMAHPDGDEATARAAAAAGTIMCLSSAATCAPAELPDDGPRWFQVY